MKRREVLLFCIKYCEVFLNIIMERIIRLRSWTFKKSAESILTSEDKTGDAAVSSLYENSTQQKNSKNLEKKNVFEQSIFTILILALPLGNFSMFVNF